jgi:hypothetical protein
MVTTSGHRVVLAAFFAACFVVLVPAASPAQSSIGFIGGASIDPEQAFAGVYWESPNIGGSFRLRPGIDGGFGDNLRLGTIKFTGEFEDYEQELHAGGSYLFGFQHANGFFTEFRVGGGSYVPGLKMGVGWAIEIK